MFTNKTIPVITIDGPAGAGKGVIREKLATKLQWHQLDSGLLYRALACYYMWHHNGVGLVCANIVSNSQHSKHIDEMVINGDGLVFDSKINFKTDFKLIGSELATLATKLNLSFKQNDIYLEDPIGCWRKVTLELRSENCANLASEIATLVEVRKALLSKQHDFLKLPGLVADGRDLGTVVFPDAVLKIFLDADPKVRALRREMQLKEYGVDGKLYNRTSALVERDLRDKQRELAPLKPAMDAIQIDTTNMTIEEVFNVIMKQVNLIILR